MYKLIDLSHLNWGTSRAGGLSYGCYYKATDIINGKKYYYKCSNYFNGQNVFGDESINEVICSRFLSKLGFNCVKYTLVYATVRIQGRLFNTYVCKSEDFSKGYSSRTTFEKVHYYYSNLTTSELIDKLGIRDEIRCMIIADFLTLQRDRHGGNIELLEKNGRLKLSPLFDNGLGLLAPYPSVFGNNIASFDVLHDYPVNNYIGYRSLYRNLEFIDKPIRVSKLFKEDRSYIFRNLKGVLPDNYLDKIWELLVYRYMFLRKRGIIIDS